MVLISFSAFHVQKMQMYSASLILYAVILSYFFSWTIIKLDSDYSDELFYFLMQQSVCLYFFLNFTSRIPKHFSGTNLTAKYLF